MLIRLLPDLLALLDIVRRVEGVVDADHDDQGPGEGHKDAIEVQSMRVMSLTTGEGIIDSHDDGWQIRWVGRSEEEEERGKQLNSKFHIPKWREESPHCQSMVS